MRSDFTQLPSVQETEDILAKEAKRQIPPTKLDLHYPDFSPVISWLKLVGLPTRIFTDQVSWQEAMATGGDLQPQLVKRTLELSNQDTWLHQVEIINTYLGETDEPEKADLILVFGSKDLRRVQHAVDLWKKGLAPMLVMAGGNPNYGLPSQSEAEVFNQEAISLGVPREKIVIESNSITVPDNVRSTLNILDEKKISFNKVIIVISWFAMRRAWVHLMKYRGETIQIYRTCPEPHNPHYIRAAWYLNEDGIKVIFNEFVKMRVAEMMNTA
jgi:hypothetical protein